MKKGLRSLTQPNEILNRLRENVIHALHQTGKEEEAKDGMDITICTILNNENKLQFAGANNPLYILLDNEMRVIKGDKMPIAFYDNMQPFTLHELTIKKNDVFYIFLYFFRWFCRPVWRTQREKIHV